MMNKEESRKSINESTGIYIGRAVNRGFVLFCEMKQKDIPNESMQVGLLGEGKRIMVRELKGETNHMW